ncbi:hypothetical protein P4H71_26010 [Paenibacillus kribbensis]|nr:hypothetical protein [Paenibacillus kribbensis]MEC0237776.1 hypothetical protein [Paenibacillus kribbensis]
MLQKWTTEWRNYNTYERVVCVLWGCVAASVWAYIVTLFFM